MKRVWILAVAAALSVACNSNNNRGDIAANNTEDNAASVGTAGEDRLGVGDRDFVEDSMEAGMAEIELGRLASQKAQSADVKRYAEMMVADHTKAGEALKQAVAAYNITAPASVDDDHRNLNDRLAKLTGAEFDREYMKAMVDSHQDVVNHLESRVDKESLGTWRQKWNAAIDKDKTIPEVITPERSDNPASMAINGWAANTLPTAEMHLAQAKAQNEKLEQRGRNATD